MNLEHVIKKLDLNVLTNQTDLANREPIGGYTSDLLSCVMAGAQPQNIWVTLQAHINIVAVAALRDVCAVIITEGAEPEPSTVSKANEEGVVLLSTPEPSYQVIGKLWDLGLH